MIDIDNLTYRYNRKKTLFKNLSLKLHTGQVYGLLGKNGAGKSSLIKNIAGLLIPFNGTCRVNERVSSQRSAAFFEGLFFLPEESELPQLAVPQFLDIYGRFYPDFDETQFYENLKVFNVAPDSHLRQLSFGQKKKAYIAFALAANTPLLIMDEPTNGLDIPSKIQFRKMVADSNREDKITIISTHQVRDLDDLITSVLIMDDSKILLHADKKSIIKSICFEPGEHDEAIYTESTATGTVSMMRNHLQTQSYLDLEVLFNAVLKGIHINAVESVPPLTGPPVSPHPVIGKPARFLLLFKRQFQENKRLYRVLALAMAGALLCMFFVTWHFRNSFSGGTNQGILLIGLFLGGSIFMSTLLKDLGQPSKAVWLMTLPASVDQKLLIAVIYGILFYLIGFLAIFFLTQAIFSLIIGENSVHMDVAGLWKNAFYEFVFSFINIQLLVLLGSLAFRRAAFIKTLILILSFFLIANTANNALLAMITGEKSINGGALFDYFQFVHNNENVYIYLPERLRMAIGLIFHYLVPLFIYYIIHLKFQEKEI